MNLKTVLITGASGGIGLELSKIFSENGYNLVLVARSEDKLTEISSQLTGKNNIKCKIIVKDLALQTAPREIFEELQKDNIVIDILVNNAGFGAYGEFKDSNLTTQMEMIEVNVSALTHLCKLFLEKSKPGNKILNIASTAAFQPGPLMAVYFATKAYVLSFSEALHEELKDLGITVTALCPGATATGFEKRANLENSNLFSRNIMDAKTVAKIGYNALMKGKRVEIAGFKNALMARSVKFAPKSLVLKVVKNINGPKK